MAQLNDLINNGKLQVFGQTETSSFLFKSTNSQFRIDNVDIEFYPDAFWYVTAREVVDYIDYLAEEKGFAVISSISGGSVSLDDDISIAYSRADESFAVEVTDASSMVILKDEGTIVYLESQSGVLNEFDFEEFETQGTINQHLASIYILVMDDDYHFVSDSTSTDDSTNIYFDISKYKYDRLYRVAPYETGWKIWQIK